VESFGTESGSFFAKYKSSYIVAPLSTKVNPSTKEKIIQMAELDFRLIHENDIGLAILNCDIGYCSSQVIDEEGTSSDQIVTEVQSQTKPSSLIEPRKNKSLPGFITNTAIKEREDTIRVDKIGIQQKPISVLKENENDFGLRYEEPQEKVEEVQSIVTTESKLLSRPVENTTEYVESTSPRNFKKFKKRLTSQSKKRDMVHMVPSLGINKEMQKWFEQANDEEMKRQQDESYAEDLFKTTPGTLPPSKRAKKN